MIKIKELISKRCALNIIIALLIAVLVFHVLVLIGVVSYKIVWAGKISTNAEMRSLEIISIGVNAFTILIMIFKAGYIQNRISIKILNGTIWFLVGLFSLNTIGNLFAESRLELYYFTPISFIMAILCLRIVRSK